MINTFPTHKFRARFAGRKAGESGELLGGLGTVAAAAEGIFFVGIELEARLREFSAYSEDTPTYKMLRPAVEHFMWPVDQLGPQPPVDVLGTLYQTDVLSTAATGPRVVRIKSFLSEEECALIVDWARPEVSPARTGSANSGGLHLDIRSSSMTWLKRATGQLSDTQLTPVQRVVEAVSRRCVRPLSSALTVTSASVMPHHLHMFGNVANQPGIGCS